MAQNTSSLISIANTDLAQKLEEKAAQVAEIESLSKVEFEHTLKTDIWQAVLILNIIRYVTAITLIGIVVSAQINTEWSVIDNLQNPGTFLVCAIVLLLSAIAFSYLSKNRLIPLDPLLLGQFALDLILVTVVIHITGSIASNFSILYFIVTTTGAVTLPRKFAVGLAAGAVILMFYEHFYSLWSNDLAEAHYARLAISGLVLFFFAWLISSIAQGVRRSEIKNYVPGDETIEEYLVRQEKTALKAALKTTDGNKTEAAKLLGMTFRSFRYKLTKYDID